MEAEEILQNIFKANDIVEITGAKFGDNSTKHSSASEGLRIANACINDALSKSILAQKLTDDRPGRIGPKLVRFDLSTHHGLFIVSPDRLSINSHSNFCTMRANTGVYQGKWMYELQLGSKGVMQLGWATTKCKFDQESGVGDTINSYAYDGNRMRKWNVTTHKYGEPWLTGDIIGCLLDMDDGTIDFYRNGRNLGRAFENISMGAGIAYFPTVSLAFTENLTANFGATPLRYPVEGYQPLQAVPESQVIQANLLFRWFGSVIEEVKNIENRSTLLADGSMTVHAFLMCVTRSILKYVGPLLTVPYIVEAIFVPFMQELSGSRKDIAKDLKKLDENTAKLMICLDLLWTFLEESEMKACLESTVIYLHSSFRHVSLLLEYSDQYKSLLLLTRICQHPATRQHLLQYLLFDRVRFANFVHVKPLDEGGLADVVGEAWWETNPIDPSIDASKDRYLQACEKIKAAIAEVEAVQVVLLMTLLDNTDSTTERPASRTIFLRKFKRLVHENFVSNRVSIDAIAVTYPPRITFNPKYSVSVFLQTTPLLQTPLPITLCCFHRLLVAFRYLWDSEIKVKPVFVPCRVFYDASINYSGIDRLGGVLSHLNKTFKKELTELLGPDHEVIVAMNQTQDAPNTFVARLADFPSVLPAFPRMINVTSTSQGNSVRFEYLPYSWERRTPMPLGAADALLSLLELLDGIILFYHVAAKKQLAKVASLRNSMSEYITALADTKARLELVRNKEDDGSRLIQKELLRTQDVFGAKLTEQARHMAWIRAAVYSEEKQEHLAWLLRVVTLTLKKASEEGNMFSFVPDFYLEALYDLCVGIRNHVHPTTPIEKISGYREMLLDAAEFLCNHFLDPRIVHANAKDTLVVALAGFVYNPLTLEALENVSEESRLKVVSNLLKPYENRAWAQSNWVLVRFWQGHGFAFRYEKSPHLSRKVGPKLLQQESISQPIKPCPSLIYQMHVRDALLKKPQDTVQFLNLLLNQLNWAFSEFIGMVQEIHNVSSRPERVFIESRQLKICATCFDLAISLLRVLEMICTVAPSTFNDPNQSSSENLLSRLCQLLCQVLNRMSSQTSCFQHVVLLEIPDLESVDHFPILAAVIGILLALLKEDMELFASKTMAEVPKVTKTLLTEPSFQISSLYFVLGETKYKNTKAKNIKPFTFLNYQEDVTQEEISRVRAMLNYLDSCRVLLPDTKVLSDDENTCTICYAFPIGATFKPCNHQTCRTCIDRHLLNTRECFFCKSTISKVIDLTGNILHDFANEATNLKYTKAS